MPNPDDENTFHQQTTVPAGPSRAVAQVPSVTSMVAKVPTAPLAVANVPSWPPPPRPRPSQGMSRRARILLATLAAVLVLSGLGLLIYSTTSQYDRKLGALDGSDATSTARATLHSQATRNAQATRTAVPLQTADAQIYATATASAAPGATASATGAQGTATTQVQVAALTKITSGTAAFNDPLSGNTQNHGWDVGYMDNNQTGCNFVNSSYKVQEALPSFLRPCFADNTSFRNFAYQVSMTLASSCSGGVLFRGNKDKGTYYLFTVNANGTYLFEVYGSSANSHVTLASGTNAAILGVSQTNTLAVIADKTVIDLFVNQTFLAEISDVQLLGAGQVGVAVYNTGLPASATFSNAEVWKI